MHLQVLTRNIMGVSAGLVLHQCVNIKHLRILLNLIIKIAKKNFLVGPDRANKTNRSFTIRKNQLQLLKLVYLLPKLI